MTYPTTVAAGWMFLREIRPIVEKLIDKKILDTNNCYFETEIEDVNGIKIKIVDNDWKEFRDKIEQIKHPNDKSK